MLDAIIHEVQLSNKQSITKRQDMKGLEGFFNQDATKLYNTLKEDTPKISLEEEENSLETSQEST
jgi:hypothetical protein